METIISPNLKTSILFILILTLISGCTIPSIEVEAAGSTLFECKSTGESYACLKLSGGTGTRCYLDESAWYNQPKCVEGWKVKSSVKPDIGDKAFQYNGYHCYPKRDCCTLHGNLDNPCVLMSEVIG